MLGSEMKKGQRRYYHGSHSRYRLQYHLVWVPKYRKRLLVGDVATEIKKLFPELKSITTDNDILWQYHKKLEQALGVPFYFCDPYSSYQKGSVENFNGGARTYIKKSSDISQYNEAYIQMTEDKLNNRYMKVLGYKTPKEALEEYRKNQKKT